MDNIQHNRLNCDIICDLLPLYHDGVASAATLEAVEQHIAGCEKCRRELDALRESLPCKETMFPVTQKKFAAMVQTQKRKRILQTVVCVAAIIALLTSAYFGQLQLSIFDVPADEIAVHRVYRYQTDKGDKIFLLYSAPHYAYSRISTKIKDDGTTLEFRKQKPLITQKSKEVGVIGRALVYDGIYGSNKYDIGSLQQVKFGKTVIQLKDNEPIPDYVYAYEEYFWGSDRITTWLCAVDEGYVGAMYADGTTVLWDLDGNVISS